VKSLTKYVLVAVLGVALLASAGCVRAVPRAQETPTDRTEKVAMGPAQAIDLTLEMGYGDLRLKSAAETQNAVAAHFTYTPDSLRPEIDSSTEGTTSMIRIFHPKGSTVGVNLGNTESAWDLAVAHGVPTKLGVQFGAGEGMLDLRGIKLTDFSLQQGAGTVTVDLSDQSGGLGVRSMLGAGELTLRVPKSVPVKVTGYRGGVGDWSAPGFAEKNSVLVNDAYQASPGAAAITIDVQRGVGQLNLIEVP
jgi:hypothetical protein